jgi:hypothetical protein
MTSKEFAIIREFYGTHYNLNMRGHVWLFPQAIKRMHTASDVAKAWARKNASIYIKPTKMRVDGNHVRIMCSQNGVFLVHRRYIKSMLLFNYNY